MLMGAELDSGLLTALQLSARSRHCNQGLCAFITEATDLTEHAKELRHFAEPSEAAGLEMSSEPPRISASKQEPALSIRPAELRSAVCLPVVSQLLLQAHQGSASRGLCEEVISLLVYRYGTCDMLSRGETLVQVSVSQAGFMVQFKDNDVVKVDHPSPEIALVRVPGRFWYSSLTDMFQLDIFAFGPREDDPPPPAPVRKSQTPAHHT